jgi:hypothetical protein
MAEFLLDFDHKSLSPQEYRGKFLHFLQQYALPQVTHVVLSGGPKSHHSVQVRSLYTFTVYDSNPYIYAIICIKSMYGV